MQQVIYKPRQIDCPQGVTKLLFENEGRPGVSGGQYRFSVVGAGTVDIQPIFAGISTHKAETVTNDSVVLDYSAVENVELTASGGDAIVIATVLGANC